MFASLEDLSAPMSVPFWILEDATKQPVISRLQDLCRFHTIAPSSGTVPASLEISRTVPSLFAPLIY